MAGGVLIGAGPNGPAYVALVSIVVAVIGRIAAAGVPHSPASAPGLKVDWNPLSETWRNLRFAHANRTLFLSMLGISWLWFFGSIFLTSFTGFAREVLGGDQS